MTLNTSKLSALADQLLAVQLALQPLHDQEASLKAQIRELLAGEGPGEYLTLSGNTIKAQANRRLDLAAIARDYPPTTQPGLYTLKPDTAKVRAALSPNEIDQYMTLAGDMRIGFAS